MNEDIIICRCEEVTQKRILGAIREGATTAAGIKIRTRAGMGPCQGRFCRNLIVQSLAEQMGISPDKIPSLTARPPVRMIKLGNLGELDDD